VCIEAAARGCRLAGASCLLSSGADTCITENECSTLTLPPDVDIECVLENCREEFLDAHTCLSKGCPAYARCFP